MASSAQVAETPTLVLDTSSVSNSFRAHARGVISPYLEQPNVPAISFQTEAELLSWERSRTLSPARRAQIRDFLQTARIIYATHAAAVHCATIVRRRLDAGRSENLADAWIAATALANSLPLVTFDKTGFSDIPGLDLAILDAPLRRPPPTR